MKIPNTSAIRYFVYIHSYLNDFYKTFHFTAYFDDIQHIPFRWRSLVKSMNVICPTDISKNSANKNPNTVLSGQLSIKDIVGTMNVSELYFSKVQTP